MTPMGVIIFGVIFLSFPELGKNCNAQKPFFAARNFPILLHASISAHIYYEFLGIPVYNRFTFSFPLGKLIIQSFITNLIIIISVFLSFSHYSEIFHTITYDLNSRGVDFMHTCTGNVLRNNSYGQGGCFRQLNPLKSLMFGSCPFLLNIFSFPF